MGNLELPLFETVKLCDCVREREREREIEDMEDREDMSVSIRKLEYVCVCVCMRVLNMSFVLKYSIYRRFFRKYRPKPFTTTTMSFNHFQST